MAKNTRNRIPVKWIRDGAKSAYEKKDYCYICNTSEDLELHHTHSITLLLERWVKATGHDVSTDEAVLAIRDEFIQTHHKEMYDDVFTLCAKHHIGLHGVYGKAPALNSAQKQSDWIEKQREKLTNSDSPDKPVSKVLVSRFSEFY